LPDYLVAYFLDHVRRSGSIHIATKPADSFGVDAALRWTGREW